MVIVPRYLLKRTEMLGVWNKMQKDFLPLSADIKQILVPNSGHYINQEQPEVIETAINEMVNKVSNKK